jgi:hypothetical protein
VAHHEDQVSALETEAETTRSGTRFREIAAINLYTRRYREIASGGISFDGGYEQEFGIHFDPGPQVRKLLCR